MGVEGFRVVPDGYIAMLDLTLDVSTMAIALDEAAAKTIRFIRANAASDLVFEVVIADAADGS